MSGCSDQPSRRCRRVGWHQCSTWSSSASPRHSVNARRAISTLTGPLAFHAGDRTSSRPDATEAVRSISAGGPRSAELDRPMCAHSLGADRGFRRIYGSENSEPNRVPPASGRLMAEHPRTSGKPRRCPNFESTRRSRAARARLGPNAGADDRVLGSAPGRLIDREGWVHYRRPWARRGWPFVVTGRSKDIIIRGGENIATPTVESALLRHPAVRNARSWRCPTPISESAWSSDRARPVHVPVGSGSGRVRTDAPRQTRGADRLVAHDRPAAHDRSWQRWKAKAEHDLASGVAIRTDSQPQSPRELDEAMPHRGRTLHRRLPTVSHRQQGEVAAAGFEVGQQGLGHLGGCAAKVRLRKSS